MILAKINTIIAAQTGVQIGPLVGGSVFAPGKMPTSVGSFITIILPQVYIIAGILVLVYLVWGGYRYMMSGGDPKGAAAARAQLTWAVVGMIIVFLSYWIYLFILQLLSASANP
jgi:hypothetical protein